MAGETPQNPFLLGLEAFNKTLPSLTGAISDIYGIFDTERKFNEQVKQQEYANQFAEKQFAETQSYNAFNRYLAENGVQVRANDLAKAGLSKVLASGSTPSYVSAGTGGSVSASSYVQGFKAQALLQGLQMSKQFQQKDQEIKLLKEQIKNQQLDNDYKQFEVDYWKKLGIPSNADMWQRRGLGLFQTIQDMNLIDHLNNFSNNLSNNIDSYLHAHNLDRYRPHNERVYYTPTDTTYLQEAKKSGYDFSADIKAKNEYNKHRIQTRGRFY